MLPALWPLLEASNEQARLIALVKPQFEAGKEAVAKGKGVIKDAATQEACLEDVVAFARAELSGCCLVGSIESPILGGDGNKDDDEDGA